MLVCAGCAAKQTPSHVAGPADPSAQTAAEPRSWRVVMEDDGLPAQLAPRHRAATPDDPREPWSPNYGSVPVKASVAPAEAALGKAAAPAPVQPKRAQAASGKQRQFENFDADDVMRRAIAEHEMRQPR